MVARPVDILAVCWVRAEAGVCAVMVLVMMGVFNKVNSDRCKCALRAFMMIFQFSWRPLAQWALPATVLVVVQKFTLHTIKLCRKHDQLLLEALVGHCARFFVTSGQLLHFAPSFFVSFVHASKGLKVNIHLVLGKIPYGLRSGQLMDVERAFRVVSDRVIFTLLSHIF